MIILKNWLIIALMLIFLILFLATFFGWFKPLGEMQPTIYFASALAVLTGYLFGRMPSEQNEQTLKEEISRQMQKSDAAQFAKEHVQQERECLEEKLRNVRLVLKQHFPNEMNDFKPDQSQLIKTAISILDS